jgi:MFS family permease
LSARIPGGSSLTTTIEGAPRTAALLSSIFMAFGVFWGGFGALLPDLKSAVGANDGELGRALIFIALGAIVGMTVAGRRADAIGTAGLLPSGVAFGIAIIPIGLASDVGWLVPTFVLLGVTTGILDVFINAGVSVFESVNGRPLMGRAHAFFSLGVLVASPVVGIARNLGAGPFSVLCGLAVTVLLVSAAMPLVTLPRPEAKQERVRLSRTLVLFGALCAMAFLIEDGLLSWSALHLEETMGGSPLIGGLGPAALAASMVIGRFLTQLASDRFSARQIIAAAGLMATAGSALFAQAPNALIALPAIAVTGLAISTCAPVIFGTAGRVGGSGRQAGAIAITTTIAYMGFVIGPALVGSVAGAAGLRAGLMVPAVAAFLMLVGSRLIPRRLL